ncbi:MAG: hypothetical protein FWF59_05485 [Turicibacter sp.]|nr:hypothetical protein [Turicibacter sp.]
MFFIISGLLILIGTMGIAILLAARAESTGTYSLLVSTAVSAFIAVYNFATMPYGSAPDKAVALLMGGIALFVWLACKKKPNGWLAKLAVSSTILVGLSQLIYIH